MVPSKTVFSVARPVLALLALGMAAFTVACSAGSVPLPPAAPESQSRCTLTYAAGTPSYTFTVGQFGSAEGGVLADGECSGIGQSVSQPLPDGLAFSVDRGGRRWIISGTPTVTTNSTRYTIQAKATIGSGSATRTTSRSINLRVEP